MILLLASSAMAKTKAKVEPMASLTLEQKNQQIIYSLKPTENQKEAFLERKGSKISNKTIKIPMDLAGRIKGDILSLSWSVSYKPSIKATKGCDVVVILEVQSEEKVSICKEQTYELSQSNKIAKQLDDLLKKP